MMETVETINLVDEYNKLKTENERLRRLIKVLLDNDPDDMAADAVTVLMVWREEARAALKEKE